jgi:hypothetical protein
VLCIVKENSNNKKTKTVDDLETEIKENPIYVKVDEKTRTIIDKYKESGKSMSHLIQEAIKIYDDYKSIKAEIKAIIKKHKEKDDDETFPIKFLEKAVKFYGEQKELGRDLFLRMRDEMKMMLIGKTTFNQLLAAAREPKDATEMSVKHNVGFDLIMWHNNSRPLKSLTLEEIIHSVQKLWVVANYFYTIDVNKINEDQYHLLFRHRQDKYYSDYWLYYFTEFFTSKELGGKYLVEGQAFEESISIIIKIGYK